MIEIKDKNYSELDKDESFTEYCELVVKTTDENGNTTEEEKEGIQIKGKDMLYLNAPEIYFPENAPLDTEKRELYDILNELFQDGGEGGDWQPPPWWIPVPEPQEYEMYFLIYTNTSRDFGMLLTNEERKSGVKVNAFFDWGDGTMEEIEGNTISNMFNHTYENDGQYLVKVVTNDTSNYIAGFKNTASSGMPIQIAKLGEQTVLSANSTNYRVFRYQYALNYIVVNGDYDIGDFVFQYCLNLKRIDIKNPPSELAEYAFSGCSSLRDSALKKITENLTAIPKGAFINCYGIRSIDILNCTSIGDNAFNNCYCLNTVNAPNCTAMGNSAFYDCYSLNEITTAENCTFDDGCFTGCYSLYPKPNGQTN